MDAPEPPLTPPDPPKELRMTDWSIAAWVSVRARTPEEAEERAEMVVAHLNSTLAVDGFRGAYGAIVQVEPTAKVEEA